MSEILFHVKTMPSPLIRSPSRRSKLGGKGESEKTKRRWKYGAGAVLLKIVEGALAFSLFNFFKAYHFYI